MGRNRLRKWQLAGIYGDFRQSEHSHQSDVFDEFHIDHQHLEATEDLSVHLLTLEEVKRLLDNNEIMQALNAAPLWKYIASL